MDWAQRADKISHNINKWVVIVLVAIMTVTVLIGVVSRSVGISIPWTQELAEFSFVWLSLLGSAVVFREKGHILVDFTNSMFPATSVKYVKLTGDGFLAAFLILLAFTGIRLALVYFPAKSPVLGMSIGFHYLSVPIACLLMLLNQLSRLSTIANGRS